MQISIQNLKRLNVDFWLKGYGIQSFIFNVCLDKF